MPYRKHNTKRRFYTARSRVLSADERQVRDARKKRLKQALKGFRWIGCWSVGLSFILYPLCRPNLGWAWSLVCLIVGAVGLGMCLGMSKRVPRYDSEHSGYHIEDDREL